MKREVVKCMICSTECSGHEAGVHKVLTGHNYWELLLPEQAQNDTSTSEESTRSGIGQQRHSKLRGRSEN